MRKLLPYLWIIFLMLGIISLVGYLQRNPLRVEASKESISNAQPLGCPYVEALPVGDECDALGCKYQSAGIYYAAWPELDCTVSTKNHTIITSKK